MSEYNKIFNTWRDAINDVYGHNMKNIHFNINDEDDFDYTVMYYHYDTTDDIFVTIRYISARGTFVVNCMNTLERDALKSAFIHNFNISSLESGITDIVKVIYNLCNMYEY